MPNPRRVERVQKQIHRAVAQAMLHGLSDPRAATLITITKVKLSPDMGVARVYFSVLGTEEDKRTAARLLEHVGGRLRMAVGDAIQSRTVPALRFEYDPSIEGTIAIDAKIREVEAELQRDAQRRGEVFTPTPDSPKAAQDALATASTTLANKIDRDDPVDRDPVADRDEADNPLAPRPIDLDNETAQQVVRDVFTRNRKAAPKSARAANQGRTRHGQPRGHGADVDPTLTRRQRKLADKARWNEELDDARSDPDSLTTADDE